LGIVNATLSMVAMALRAAETIVKDMANT